MGATLLGSVGVAAICNYRNDDANEAAPKRLGSQHMRIVPTGIEEQINRVDRQRSLYIGISAGAVAVWSVFRLIWTLYIALAFDGLVAALVFPFVLWAVIGTVAAIAAFGFLTRYSRGS